MQTRFILILLLYGLIGQNAFAETMSLPELAPQSRLKNNAASKTLSVNISKPAKQLFGAMKKAAPLQARAIGFYSRGCLAGAKALPIDGPYWQAMRLSRNRNWGHPILIRYLERLANEAGRSGDWPGLLVGDLAQPRGGPMLSGHASHQIGLDADIWLTPMPKQRLSREEREKLSAISMLKKSKLTVDTKKWSTKHFRLIRRAASYPEVARIFVHPGIKRALCRDEKSKRRAWLRKVRPWYGHHYHFHIRLSCPKGMKGCRNQPLPPKGDGCGKELDWWFTSTPWTPKKPKKTDKKVKPRHVMLSDLPNACQRVLSAQ